MEVIAKEVMEPPRERESRRGAKTTPISIGQCKLNSFSAGLEAKNNTPSAMESGVREAALLSSSAALGGGSISGRNSPPPLGDSAHFFTQHNTTL
ncbi:unnamed protein product [Caenorhabditis auriculariae]|uniref:Uncharacterized protein n=1 Tax=Caenorhabditis auriculariae TaxID=2777116 RepID=A0A8S1GSM7_9PELO|nr:unnamed protein product [Caenorhabditis auriculariae]